MRTLVLIGLVGGLITGISPCILPELPIVFFAAARRSRGVSPREFPPRAHQRQPTTGVCKIGCGPRSRWCSAGGWRRGFVEIVVTDRGLGIAPEDQERRPKTWEGRYRRGADR